MNSERIKDELGKKGSRKINIMLLFGLSRKIPLNWLQKSEDLDCSWTLFVCLQLTLLFNFVDSQWFYICFQAQGKFCSTPHLISHLVFYSLWVLHSRLPWIRFHAACHSLSLSQHLCNSLSVCLPMHADVCLDEACAAMTDFYLESLWFDFIQQNFFFPCSLSI